MAVLSLLCPQNIVQRNLAQLKGQRSRLTYNPVNVLEHNGRHANFRHGMTTLAPHETTVSFRSQTLGCEDQEIRQENTILKFQKWSRIVSAIGHNLFVAVD